MSRRRPMTEAERLEQEEFFSSFTVQKIVPPVGKARTPSVAKLIHLLIEERAKVLALRRGKGFVGHIDRDQARAEIEAEVLR